MKLLVLLATAMSLSAASIYDFSMKKIDGGTVPLSSYKGEVVLVVNVASKCGFTPQYSALESTYRKYKDQGFVILGFPANNFGGQEPGSDAEIKTFCSRTYQVDFPMFSKVSVKGADQTPLYQYLTSQTGGEIGWNFTKILVGRDGKILNRFDSSVTPDSADMTAAIEKALAQK